VPKTALIIDDDETVRLFVAGVMSGAGWACLEAADGESGVDLAEAEKPDLIILDIRMPRVDGFEAFRRLRNSPITGDIPIIMLSGVNDERGGLRYEPRDFETAYDVRQPEGFVDKPVDADFLLKSVMGVMG